VRDETLRSKRTEYPTIPPTASPNFDAIKAAAPRAASRRGSSIRIFFPSSHGASSKAGGTQVVFPDPGGARKTTSRFAADEAAIAGIISSTGKVTLLQNSLLIARQYIPVQYPGTADTRPQSSPAPRTLQTFQTPD
jgi:hypothetical protein